MTQAMRDFEAALDDALHTNGRDDRAAVLALHAAALARTIEFDGVRYDLEDMRAVARTALENWNTCLKERDEALARADEAEKERDHARSVADQAINDRDRIYDNLRQEARRLRATIDALMDPIVRAKMLEPAQPIFIERPAEPPASMREAFEKWVARGLPNPTTWSAWMVWQGAFEAALASRPTSEPVGDLVEALEFYADPDTYFGVGFAFDPPCGDFATDFGDDHEADFTTGPLPGERARAAIAAWNRRSTSGGQEAEGMRVWLYRRPTQPGKAPQPFDVAWAYPTFAVNAGYEVIVMKESGK